MFICSYTLSNEQINNIYTLVKQLCVDKDDVLILNTNFATTIKKGSVNSLKRVERTQITCVLGCIATFVAYTDTPQDRKEMISLLGTKKFIDKQ